LKSGRTFNNAAYLK